MVHHWSHLRSIHSSYTEWDFYAFLSWPHWHRAYCNKYGGFGVHGSQYLQMPKPAAGGPQWTSRCSFQFTPATNCYTADLIIYGILYQWGKCPWMDSSVYTKGLLYIALTDRPTYEYHSRASTCKHCLWLPRGVRLASVQNWIMDLKISFYTVLIRTCIFEFSINNPQGDRLKILVMWPSKSAVRLEEIQVCLVEALKNFYLMKKYTWKRDSISSEHELRLCMVFYKQLVWL